MPSVQPWSGPELEEWCGRAASAGTTREFGVAQSAVQLIGSTRLVSYVAWYTDGFFNDPQVPTCSTLFVHEVDDAAYLRMTRRASSDGLVLADLPFARAVCLLQRSEKQIHLFVCGNLDQMGIAAVRVLRALVLDRLLAEGSWFAHAACVSVHDIGVALIGARTAGKTTLLLQCLDQLNAALIANDKIALNLDLDGVEPIATGFPIRVGIRAGSILALANGRLRQHLLGTWDDKIGHIERHRLDDRTRLVLRPQDLADAAHASIRPACRLRLAIVPTLDPSMSAPVLLEVHPQDAEQVWRENRLISAPDVFPEQAALASPRTSTYIGQPSMPVYRLIQPPSDGRRSTALIEDLVHRIAAGA